MGDDNLGIGDIIMVGDKKYTVDLDDSGYEIAVDENRKKINEEGHYTGGKKTRKHKHKSGKHKLKSRKHKHKSRKHKLKSRKNKRKSQE